MQTGEVLAIVFVISLVFTGSIAMMIWLLIKCIQILMRRKDKDLCIR